MTDWEIERFKVELPDGLSSIPHDGLVRLCAKIGSEYSKTHNTDNLKAKIAWTPDAETTFKESMLNTHFVKGIDKNLRVKYCDCLLTEFKKTYPDSLSTPIPDSITINAVQACNAKLSISKK